MRIEELIYLSTLVAYCYAAATTNQPSSTTDYRVVHVVMENVLLNIYFVFCRLAGLYCSCHDAQLKTETSYFNVNESYSMTT